MEAVVVQADASLRSPSYVKHSDWPGVPPGIADAASRIRVI
ncbi:hypothetical protein [Sphaerisporangium album]|nr:hypothetical protein [Sphaerisporangium album]